MHVKPSRNVLRIVATIGIILLGLFSALLIYTLALRYIPISLPAPSGNYHVGRVEYNFTDASRIDTLASQNNTKRKLVVWVWYPTNAAIQANRALYFPEAWANALNGYQAFNQLGLHNYVDILTNSIGNAPIAHDSSKYPLLIMEPGLGLSAPDYTVYAENLASHGYIVVGITPTYSADVTVFLNGTIARQTQKGLISNINSNVDGSRLLNVWTQDVIFVMNQMVDLNKNKASMFYDMADIQKIGIFGHSFGGATALNVCLKASRCRAGADIDGSPFGDVVGQPETKPFLYIAHDYLTPCGISCSSMQQLYNNTDAPAYLMSIKGTNHLNYSDASLQYSFPLDFSGNFGPVDKLRALSISNAYLVSFFDKYLKGRGSPLLLNASKYPEVTFNSKG